MPKVVKSFVKGYKEIMATEVDQIRVVDDYQVLGPDGKTYIPAEVRLIVDPEDKLVKRPRYQTHLDGKSEVHSYLLPVYGERMVDE